MESGKLRHRVEIQEKNNVQDSETGSTSVEWVKVATVWADVNPLSAREAMNAQAMQSKVMAKITIRYRAGINAAMRIVFREKYYNIEGIIPDNKSGLEHITLQVSEGANDV